MADYIDQDVLARRVALVKARIAAAAAEAGRDPSEIALSAATKTQPVQVVRAAIAAGISICGENRVQEMTQKMSQFAYEGARVHMIGRLQTNKVKAVVGRVDLIESVDSLHLLQAIEDRAARLGLVQDILIQVNIGEEATKGGVPPRDALSFARQAAACPHIRLRGLMCIPPPAAFPGENRGFFALAHQLFVDIRNKIEDNNSNVDILSMGMSGDYEDAVREGATLVRLGTALFGLRHPSPPLGTSLEG